MTQMSADALKNNLSNVQRTYLWEVIIPSPVGDGDSNTFLLRCRSTAIPARRQGQILVPFKQSAGVAYPGKLAYDHTWACVFVEGEDKKVFDAFYSWMQEIVHDRLNTGSGDLSIKADLYLTLQSTAGENTTKIKMIGCYPMEQGELALSYDDEGNALLPITFSYDRWEKVD